MLCLLEGRNRRSGDGAWDEPHPVTGTVRSHAVNYCVSACSISMLASYYGWAFKPRSHCISGLRNDHRESPGSAQ